MRSWVAPIALGAMLGCAPKGKPPSVPASLKPGSSAASVAAQEEKTVIPADESLQQGMPSFCEVRPAEGQECVVCRVDDLALERCFARSAEFAPQKTCTFDKHQLKCLIRDSLTVVKIPFRNSPERQFLADFPVILDNIKGIVQHGEHQEPQETSRLFALLDFIGANSRAILMGQHPSELAAQLVKVLGGHGAGIDAKAAGELEQAFVSGVQRLRTQTMQGQLNDADGLQFVRAIALPFVKNEKTVHMLKTMSVDGLSDISG